MKALRNVAIAALLLSGGITKAQNLRISGSNTHSVAICADGDVFAWGLNDNGQVGVDATLVAYPNASYNTPQLVGGLQEIFQIDAGSGRHTLALTCDGKVQAWGGNTQGQLGDGTIVNQAVPVFVSGVGGVGDLIGVSYVSAGNDESFAIMADQRAVAWGQNDQGQLGIGSTTNSPFPAYIQDGLTNADIQNVIQIEAGDACGYALVDDDGDGVGTVYSWGVNSSKDLGRTTNATFMVALPVEKSDGSYLDNIVEVTAGDAHGLAIDDNGNIYGWGADWGHGQVGDGPGYYSQDYATLVVGGASGDTYLGDSDPVIQISASQASSGAVTASGKVYSWGSDGFYNCGGSCSTPSGQLGVGCLTQAVYNVATGPNTVPLESTKTGGVSFTDAIGISDGDGWMFVLTADNSIWVTGWNQDGQLGLGDNANRCEYTELVLPGCGVVAPCPDPDLGDDFSECDGFTTTLSAGLVYPDFIAEWFYNNVSQGTEAVSGTPKLVTYPADQFGTWRVEITDNRPATDRPCNACALGVDEVVITEYARSFSDPGDNGYCGTSLTSANVNGTGTFEWYASSNSTTVLTTSTDNGDIASSIPLASLNNVGGTVYEVYVEDVSTISTNVGPPAWTGGNDGWGVNTSGTDSWLEFTVSEPVTIDFVDMYLNWNAGQQSTIEVQIQDNTGTPVVTSAPIVLTSVTSSLESQTVPVNLLVPAAGTYRMALSSNSGGGGRQFRQPSGDHPTADWTYSDPNNRVEITQSFRNGSLALNSYHLFFNWQVTYQTPDACGRLQVLVDEDCQCFPPTSVDLTTTGNKLAYCEGEDMDLNVAFNTTGITPAIDGNWYYTIFSPSGEIYTTFTSAPAGNTVAASSLTTADAGTYTFRLEDGDNDDAVCYLESAVTVTVDEVPSINSALLDNICSDNTFNYSVTSDVVGSTLTWTRATVADITQAGTTGGATIAESLTNTSTAPIDVTYVLNATGPAPGNCAATPANLVLTAKPIPVFQGALDETVCEGDATTLLPMGSDVTPATYSWTTSPSNGANIAAGYVATGTTDIPSETFTISNSTSETLTYSIVPTADGCTGTSVDHVLTINAVPEIDQIGSFDAICSGETHSGLVVTTTPAGGTINWTATGAGTLSGYTALGAGDITAETITSTDSDPQVVTYTMSSSMNSCSGTDRDFVVTVAPIPSITNTSFDEELCGGASSTSINLTSDENGTVYTWAASASNVTLGGGFDQGPTVSAALPSETITNTGSTTETLTYTITPSIGTCVGADSVHVLTVHPAPMINETGRYDSICSGETHSGLLLTSTPVGATFDYTATTSAPGDITGFTAADINVTSIPAEALINTGTAVQSVTYTITPNANGCPGGQETFIVYVNPVATVLSTPPAQNKCSGESTDAVNLQSNVPGASFSWTTSSADIDMTYATAGNGDIPAEILTASGQTSGSLTYSVVPSINGCSGTPVNILYSVTLDVIPQITNVLDAEAVCTESVTPSVVLTSTPATGVNFTWSTVSSNGASTSVVNPTGTGDFGGDVATNNGATSETVTYTVTPENGICTGNDWVYTLTVNPKPVPAIQPLTTRCEGDVFTVSNANHAGGSSYVWSTSGTGVSDDANTTQDLQITAGSGDISVTVVETNANNCASNPVNEAITVDEFPTVPTVMIPQDICIADPVTLPGTQAIVGTGVWQFSTTGTATIDDVNLFNSGVTDLTGNEVLTATWTISNGVCPDQAETIVITGRGIADPTVSLSEDDNLVCAGDVVNFTAIGNNGGTTPLYTFYDGAGGVVQAQGGSTTLSLTVTQDTSIYVELESNSSCLSDPLLNTVASASISITVDEVPSTAVAGTDIIVCQSSASLGAIAPLSGIGTWEKVSGPGTVVPGDENNAAALINGLDQATPTFYNWVIRSANDACPSSTDDVQVQQAGDLSPSDVAGQSQTICESLTPPVLTGSSFDIAANPSETGTWSAVGPAMIAQSNLDGTISNLQIGENKFVWEIANGLCFPTNTDTVTITVDEIPDAAAHSPAVITTCGETQSLDATPLNVGVGIWTNVSGPGTLVVGEESLPNARVEGLQNGTTSEFEWSTSNGVCAGTSVSVQVTKLSDISPAEIGISGDLVLPLGAATLADICETGTYAIESGSFGADEQGIWSIVSGTSVTINEDNSTNQPIVINGAGTTEVEWTISKIIGGGCPALTVGMDITVHAAPTATVVATSTDTCENTAVTFTGGIIGATDLGTWSASGPTTSIPGGNVNSTSITYSALPVGTTRLTFEVNNAGCDPVTAFEDVSIEQITDPTINIDYAGANTLCAPNSISLPTSITGGGASPQYTWRVNNTVDASNNGATFNESVSDEGLYTYEVTLTSSSRCVTSNNVTDQVAISFVDGSVAQIVETDTTSCISNQVELHVSAEEGAIQWFESGQLMHGETGNTLVVTSPGTYTFSDDIGTCPPVFSSSVVVGFEQLGAAMAMGDTVICYNSQIPVVLTGAVNTNNWYWTNEDDEVFGQNDTITLVSEDEAGTKVYTMHAVPQYCPEVKDNVTVYLQSEVVPVNVFTPNGDGINDTWHIEGIESFEDAVVRVYNRWGNMIFETYGDYASSPWEGQNKKDKSENVSTYYYVIETGSESCGGAQSGYVELIRR